jgi:hypothetical protein
LHLRGSRKSLVSCLASNSSAGEPIPESVEKKQVEMGSTEENLDATHGFTRPEMMKKKPLVGSVDLYDRHVFLRYNQPSSWPAKVEAADYHPLPSKLVSTLRSKRNELPKKTRLTIADGQDEPERTNGDILVFPDMVKYKGISESDVESFVDEVLLKGDKWSLGESEPLVGTHVFICAHGSRDKRCGVCGPPLRERFNQEIALRGLGEQVFVNYCSHIGGHKYAGNVIVFRPDGGSGGCSGHWYGYVTPDDVPEIVEKHIGLGEVVDRLWRGQMGLTEDEQKEVQQKRNPSSNLTQDGTKPEGKVDAASTSTGATAPIRKKPPPPLLPRIGSRDLHQMCGDEQEEEGPLKPYEEKKKPRFKWPTWVEDWESGDTIAVVTLATAVTAIYFAYHAYRVTSQQN